jgi:BirA family transcriptional regulator, biotin operon repressor / biotin---[acetyl-CoA-carboxylase] ligase
VTASALTFGRPHRHLRRCESTNSSARELAAAGAPAGTVLTADEQTAGRGRRGRSWSAPAGKALLYSAILRPLERRHRLLPLAVPLAVCEAVERLAPVVCWVKWPNDLWIERRKCAGVLIEARPQDGWAVIGIGVNVAIEADEFPADLRAPAVSVGHGCRVADVLGAVNERLGPWVEAGEADVLSEFGRRDALRGERVGWEEGSGIATGVSEDGDLLVALDSGEMVRLGAAEVSLQPSS